MRRYCLTKLKLHRDYAEDDKHGWVLWRDDYDGWNPIRAGTFRDCALERLKEEGIYIV